MISRCFERLTAVFALALWASVAHVAAGGDDALSRAEFDREISVNMRDKDVASAFGVLARRSRVPFVLDFENEPPLKLTLNIENMNVRAVLASLASTYRFEYASSEQGIMVRRLGQERARQPVTVGLWPGPQYHIALLVRTAEGRVLSTPAVTTQQGHAMEMKQGVEQPSGRALIELKLTPTRETEAGLEVDMTMVVTRGVSEKRWTEDHTVDTRTLPKGESLLFRTDAGVEVHMRSWTRESP